MHRHRSPLPSTTPERSLELQSQVFRIAVYLWSMLLQLTTQESFYLPWADHKSGSHLRVGSSRCTSSQFHCLLAHPHHGTQSTTTRGPNFSYALRPSAQ